MRADARGFLGALPLSAAQADLLPCNSCELLEKARNAMANGFRDAGVPQLVAQYRSIELVLQENASKELNAQASELLNGNVTPDKIRVCTGMYPI
jgi:hypothetical protein